MFVTAVPIPAGALLQSRAGEAASLSVQPVQTHHTQDSSQVIEVRPVYLVQCVAFLQQHQYLL